MNQVTNVTNDLEVISLWLQQRSSNTYRQYYLISKQLLEFTGKNLIDTRLEDLTLWLRSLQLRYKPATIANKVMVIKSLFTFCYKVGYLSHNIGSLLTRPKTKDELSSKILDEEEVKLLLGSATSERDLLILKLLYGLGLRVSEVISLQWSDLNKEVLTVFGKGSKTRYVRIPDSLLNALNEIKKQSGFIFLSRYGKPLSRISVFKMIKKVASLAGLSDKVSPHYLRHSHASHSLQNGASVRLVQATLGHSSITTTEKYLHISPSESSSLFINL